MADRQNGAGARLTGRIVRREREIAAGAGLLGVSFAAAGFVTGRFGWFAPALLCFLLSGLLLVNRRARAKLAAQYAVLSPRSSVRNVDCMIVGEYADASACVEPGASCVRFQVPGRGLPSAFEIIRHAHSILRDGGTIVVVSAKRSAKNGAGPLDYPILHEITKRRYGITEGRARTAGAFPALFRPMAALTLALGRPGKRAIPGSRANANIDAFCAERGIDVRYAEVR